MGGPLSGVRVVELAHVMAGPVCGLLLADLGAEVIKVERLPNGDSTRGFVPPDIQGESAAFMMLNRGKRGIALDVRQEEGRRVVRRLAGGADVLIENFRVGTMERMGLGWEALSALNERIVYCQITGFGRTGPLAHQGGFDLIAQGWSGLMSVTGEDAGRAPVKIGAPVTDITAGILAAFGVVSALYERERTGKGQRVDTSLFEAGVTQTFWQSAIALASGVSPGPMGSAHPLAAPYQSFPTLDGWINVGASNEATWTRLTDVLNAPELRTDRRFLTNRDRMQNLDDLVRVLAPHFLERATDSWLGRLEASGVPAGPVASIGEMLEHPHTLARQMVVEVEHTAAGRVRSLGPAVKFSTQEDDEPGVRRGAPLFGEHTRAILSEAGYAEAAASELIARGVALQAP